MRRKTHAIPESFYPTPDVLYTAAVTRMFNLLGIVDQKTVLAYLGRPAHRTRQVINHTKKWDNTGSSTPITHTFYRQLPAKKGYIELFGVGYVYSVNGEWWIHWNHNTQLSLPESESIVKASKQNISPPILSTQHNTRIDEKSELDVCIERETRERVVKRERNCESESKPLTHGKNHVEKVKLTALEEAILRSRVSEEDE